MNLSRGRLSICAVASGVLAAFLIVYLAAPALAATIETVSRDEAGAENLAATMVRNPDTLTGARFKSVPPNGTPHGTSDDLSFFPTQGEEFSIMTTGNASFADAENNSGGSGANLGGQSVAGRGDTAYDVSVLELDLSAPAGTNCLSLDFAFYSEEYPEYVDSSYNDTFIAELDETTWTTDGSQISAPENFAFDQSGDVVSINSTGSTEMNDTNPVGTTYDGSTVLLEAATTITPGEHKLYLSIFDQGDHVYDSAAFVDNIRFRQVANPAAECKPGAQPVSRTPLIFVPGIAGSKLLYEKGDEKWPRATEVAFHPGDPFLRDLKLAESGNDPFDDGSRYLTKVGDIIRYEDIAPTDRFDLDVYKTTIDTLTQKYEYEEGKNLFVFPFDWRKDVRTARGGNLPGCEGVTLDEFIDCVLERTRAQNVNIMAHSQGGLVTQAALSKQESVGKVDRVLTLGTPFLGATQALGILQYQSPCFGKELLGLCFVNKGVVQEILTNFPGAYQLLPSRDFHKVEGSPLVFNSEQKSYDYWTGRIERDRNAYLMGFADAYHQPPGGRSPADHSVEWFRLVGDGVSTPDHVREYGICFIASVRLFCNPSAEIVMSDEAEGGVEGGDGTVPLHSADLYNPNPDGDGDTNDAVDLRNGMPNAYVHGVDHGDLPKNELVLAFANAYFGNVTQSAQTTSFSAQNSTEEPSPREPQDPRDTPRDASGTFSAQSSESMQTAKASGLAEQFGLDDTPKPFGGIELESVGPVEGYVEDENGNILGNPPDEPEDLIVEEIPGGQYNAIQDTQSFFLNEDGSFASNLKVTGEEGARLRVRTYDEGEMNEQAVFQVAAPEGSNLKIDFTNGQEVSDLRLSIDEDGDGTAEREEAPDSVATGSAASDTTPPEVEASYEELNSDDARVTIDATDNEGGSGIASIYYSIEGQDGQPRLYEEAFTVPLGSVIRFTATDKAGNTAGVKEIEIGDDDPPVAERDSYKATKNKTLKVRPSGGVLDNDSDPEGDKLTAELVSGPTGGKLKFKEDGSFRYKPKRSGSFTYRACDEAGACSEPVKVKIKVNKEKEE